METKHKENAAFLVEMAKYRAQLLKYQRRVFITDSLLLLQTHIFYSFLIHNSQRQTCPITTTVPNAEMDRTTQPTVLPAQTVSTPRTTATRPSTLVTTPIGPIPTRLRATPTPKPTLWTGHTCLMLRLLPHALQAIAPPITNARNNLQTGTGSAASVATAVAALPTTKAVRPVAITGDAQDAGSTMLLRSSR